MIFKTSTSRVKNSILAFVKFIVSKKVYKAIDILLTPCCHPVVKSTEATCNEENGATIVTIELVNSINLYGAGQGSIFLWLPSLNIFISTTTLYTDSNTIVFEFINSGLGGTYDASVELYMPTSSDGLIGVSLSTEIFQITLPDCNPA
jgi:hypothetical protein